MTANATPTLSIPDTPDGIDRLGQKARYNMRRYDNCTQSILSAFFDALELEAPMLMRSAGAMFGGMSSSLTCGIHTAGLMILGLFMGREKIQDGLDGLFPIILPAQDLVHQLNLIVGSHSCRELTGVDFTDLNQAIRFRTSDGHAQCAERVAQGTKEIARFMQQLDTQGDLFRLKHPAAPLREISAALQQAAVPPRRDSPDERDLRYAPTSPSTGSPRQARG